MKKIDLGKFDLREEFVELNEECQLAVDGGCGFGSGVGGSVLGGSSVPSSYVFSKIFGW